MINELSFLFTVFANPKIERDQNELNLGWPNFFNPKQAILNQVSAEKNLESEQSSEVSSESVSSTEDEVLNEENLIDYTITVMIYSLVI